MARPRAFDETVVLDAAMNRFFGAASLYNGGPHPGAERHLPHLA